MVRYRLKEILPANCTGAQESNRPSALQPMQATTMIAAASGVNALRALVTPRHPRAAGR